MWFPIFLFRCAFAFYDVIVGVNDDDDDDDDDRTAKLYDDALPSLTWANFCSALTFNCSAVCLALSTGEEDMLGSGQRVRWVRIRGCTGHSWGRYGVCYPLILSDDV